MTCYWSVFHGGLIETHHCLAGGSSAEAGRGGEVAGRQRRSAERRHWRRPVGAAAQAAAGACRCLVRRRDAGTRTALSLATCAVVSAAAGCAAWGAIESTCQQCMADSGLRQHARSCGHEFVALQASAVLSWLPAPAKQMLQGSACQPMNVCDVWLAPSKLAQACQPCLYSTTPRKQLMVLSCLQPEDKSLAEALLLGSARELRFSLPWGQAVEDTAIW